MQLSKKQWFGIITFVILLIVAYLVTKEPWKSSSGELNNQQVDLLPAALNIIFNPNGDHYFNPV
ncbi:MAG: hypothetical protein ABFS28_11880 [Bacteroidota bacterium]